MSAVTRLTLVTHAITDAVQAACFPVDEPLNTLGLRSVEKVGGLPGHAPTSVVHAPEMRAQQTTRLLGLTGTAEAVLRDLDCGDWAGQSIQALNPEQLMDWLTEPSYRAHGGESITDLLDRVRTWMTSLASRGERIVAITHPAVVRAAVLCTLNAPAEAFWRIDIAPLTATTLHHRTSAWTLRATGYDLRS